MLRPGGSRRQLARVLNAAYDDGLLSEDTLSTRLGQLFTRRVIDPKRLIGDLSARRSGRRLRSKLAGLRRRPAAEPEDRAALLALDWNVAEGELLVGRHYACDVVLSNPSVSRAHARVVFRDGGWVLQDLGSTNGTLVNGVEVGRCALHPGDLVLLGDEPLRID